MRILFPLLALVALTLAGCGPRLPVKAGTFTGPPMPSGTPAGPVHYSEVTGQAIPGPAVAPGSAAAIEAPPTHAAIVGETKSAMGMPWYYGAMTLLIAAGVFAWIGGIGGIGKTMVIGGASVLVILPAVASGAAFANQYGFWIFVAVAAYYLFQHFYQASAQKAGAGTMVALEAAPAPVWDEVAPLVKHGWLSRQVIKFQRWVHRREIANAKHIAGIPQGAAAMALVDKDLAKMVSATTPALIPTPVPAAAPATAAVATPGATITTVTTTAPVSVTGP